MSSKGISPLDTGMPDGSLMPYGYDWRPGVDAVARMVAHGAELRPPDIENAIARRSRKDRRHLTGSMEFHLGVAAIKVEV